MILDIIQHPDARLAEVCEEATPDTADSPRVKRDDELDGKMGPMESLLTDMVHTMYAANGLGLAAPQVGVLVRAICVRDKTTGKTIAMLNPRIVSRGAARTNDYEGCLSVDEGRSTVRVRRAHSVVVDGVSALGVAMRVSAKGPLAVALQHEIDHCDGRTIADRTPPRRKRHLALASSAGEPT